jgi:hypothetical protein
MTKTSISPDGSMLATLLPPVSLACIAAMGAPWSTSPALASVPSSPASMAGVPPEVVSVCRNAMDRPAKALGAIQVEAVSAGTPGQLPGGETMAPLDVRIIYRRGDEIVVRQALVTCWLSDRGQVESLLDAEPPRDRPQETGPTLRPAID